MRVKEKTIQVGRCWGSVRVNDGPQGGFRFSVSETRSTVDAKKRSLLNSNHFVAGNKPTKAAAMQSLKRELTACSRKKKWW